VQITTPLNSMDPIRFQMKNHVTTQISLSVDPRVESTGE